MLFGVQMFSTHYAIRPDALAREAEARGFSWAYWEFGAGFGVYDREKKEWREPLLKALTER